MPILILYCSLKPWRVLWSATAFWYGINENFQAVHLFQRLTLTSLQIAKLLDQLLIHYIDIMCEEGLPQQNIGQLGYAYY